MSAKMEEGKELATYLVPWKGLISIGSHVQFIYILADMVHSSCAFYLFKMAATSVRVTVWLHQFHN